MTDTEATSGRACCRDIDQRGMLRIARRTSRSKKLSSPPINARASNNSPTMKITALSMVDAE